MITEGHSAQAQKTNMTGTVLIFPIDLDTTADWITKSKALDFRVIGASSELNTHHDISEIDSFEYLPYITDEAFQAYLIDLVNK